MTSQPLPLAISCTEDSFIGTSLTAIVNALGGYTPASQKNFERGVWYKTYGVVVNKGVYITNPEVSWNYLGNSDYTAIKFSFRDGAGKEIALSTNTTASDYVSLQNTVSSGSDSVVPQVGDAANVILKISNTMYRVDFIFGDPDGLFATGKTIPIEVTHNSTGYTFNALQFKNTYNGDSTIIDNIVNYGCEYEVTAFVTGAVAMECGITQLFKKSPTTTRSTGQILTPMPSFTYPTVLYKDYHLKFDSPYFKTEKSLSSFSIYPYS